MDGEWMNRRTNGQEREKNDEGKMGGEKMVGKDERMQKWIDQLVSG